MLLSVPVGKRRLATLGAAIALAFAVSGCGEPAPQRAHVFGTVAVDGVPVAKGQIRLFALSADGTGTDAEIASGKYDIPADRGPTRASYRVEIVALKRTGRRVTDPDTNQLVDEVVNLLPARYNTASTLHITIEPGSTKPHDFDLKTK